MTFFLKRKTNLLKGSKLKFLFYVGHPAHYHNYSVVAKQLVERGQGVFYVVRPKDVLIELLNQPDRVYILPEKSGSSKLALIWSVLRRMSIMIRIVLREKPSIMIGTDLAIAQIGYVLRKTSVVVTEDDAGAVPLLANYAYPYATWILAPNGCEVHRFEKKVIRYAGYHELAYLHPDHFTPDFELVSEHVSNPKCYFVLRFSALAAHHDSGIAGIDDEFALRLAQKLEPHGQVLITSERSLSQQLEPYRTTFHPKHIHHVLAFARIVVGDSQTMAAEAGVLGTPFIRCNGFVGRLSYLEELEKTYGLGVGILPENRDKIFDILDDWLANARLSVDFQHRRERMLQEKINVADYWTQLFVELAKD